MQGMCSCLLGLSVPSQPTTILKMFLLSVHPWVLMEREYSPPEPQDTQHPPGSP